MLISLAQIQSIIARMHGVDADDATSVLSRLKYLLKRGFPRRFETRSGGRTSMTIEEALQTVLVFEMLQLGIVFGLAADAVAINWRTTLRGAVAVAVARHLGHGETTPVILVQGTSLIHEGAATMRFDVVDEETVASGDVTYARTRIAIDTHGMIAAFADALAEELVATPVGIARSLRQFIDKIPDAPPANGCAGTGAMR